jgi:hypothetical protein
MGGACRARAGDEHKKKVKSLNRRGLKKPRPLWEDNIKMDYRRIRLGVECILLTLHNDRHLVLVSTVMSLRVP